MGQARRDFWTGIGVVGLGLTLALVAVPWGVVSPRSVRIAVLSPAFWPNILAWLLVLLGGLLALRAARGRGGQTAPSAWPTGALVRLVLLTVAMLVFLVSATTLGLVWATMLLFAAVVLLTGTEQRPAAVIVTLLLPLALYAFFAHVAQVPIPQGTLVRLP